MKQKDTMKSRQGWGRAGVNKGQELKLSGKTNWNQLLPLGSCLWHTYTSPPFLAFSMHGHFLEFRPSISLWMEALPTCPTTNSYCFSWHSRQRLFVRWGACADFAASLNDLVSHRISWLGGTNKDGLEMIFPVTTTTTLCSLLQFMNCTTTYQNQE